ncbi:MAG: hypothetical protein ABS81_11295 [Pseudonocardia sp. SCN 72-86]|nr:MAG: hypothetical protein ABS81_11295 [Pseudonocardia sp. SCN 72-86]
MTCPATVRPVVRLDQHATDQAARLDEYRATKVSDATLASVQGRIDAAHADLSETMLERGRVLRDLSDP